MEEFDFVNCVNELDSAFAASGYAQVKGLGVSVNCYGIGVATGLAHLNAYCNNIPLVNILIGSSLDQMKHSHDDNIILHHYIDTNNFDYCTQFFEPISSDCYEIREQDLCDEGFIQLLEITERAHRNKLPLFLGFPSGNIDFESSILLDDTNDNNSSIIVDHDSETENNSGIDHSTIDEIVKKFEESRNPVIILGPLGVSQKASKDVEELSTLCGIPISSFWDSKGGVSEFHENYMGVHFYSHTGLEKYVLETSDFCLLIGDVRGEINHIDGTLKLPHHCVTWNPENGTYSENIKQLSTKILETTDDRSSEEKTVHKFSPIPVPEDDADLLSRQFEDPTLVYQLINQFCNNYHKNNNRNDDGQDKETGNDDFYFVLDIGDVSFGSTVDCLQVGTERMMHSGNFCALGSAIAPSHGVRVALREQQQQQQGTTADTTTVISLVGDGGFHMSSSAVSGMLHNGASKIIIVVVDNLGYTTTWTFSGRGEYNDIPFWEISKLDEVYNNDPRSDGTQLFTFKCGNGEELLDALERSMEVVDDGVSLIHVVTPKRSVSDGMRKYAKS